MKLLGMLILCSILPAYWVTHPGTKVPDNPNGRRPHPLESVDPAIGHHFHHRWAQFVQLSDDVRNL